MHHILVLHFSKQHAQVDDLFILDIKRDIAEGDPRPSHRLRRGQHPPVPIVDEMFSIIHVIPSSNVWLQLDLSHVKATGPCRYPRAIIWLYLQIVEEDYRYIFLT